MRSDCHLLKQSSVQSQVRGGSCFGCILYLDGGRTLPDSEAPAISSHLEAIIHPETTSPWHTQSAPKSTCNNYSHSRYTGETWLWGNSSVVESWICHQVVGFMICHQVVGFIHSSRHAFSSVKVFCVGSSVPIHSTHISLQT